AIQALAQDEVQTLFFHFKEEYEFVIIDVSPVLPVADALVIGQHTDAVLFSVLRDVSKLPLVYEAQQRLAALGIRMLGAVVSGERARTYGSRPSLIASARGARGRTPLFMCGTHDSIHHLFPRPRRRPCAAGWCGVGLLAAC